MNTPYEYTTTSTKLAADQLLITRFKSATPTPDRNGGNNHTLLTTRDGSHIIIYTYLDPNGEEHFAYTSYAKGTTTPDNCGGSTIKQAPTLLAGLAQFYS